MRLSNHWYRSVRRHPFKVDGVRAIYVNSMLRGMAYAVSGIFLPLYVYNWGVGIGGVRYGLGVTLLMVILERIILGFATVSFGKLVAKMGFKWSVFASSILLTIYFYLAANAQLNIYTLMILTILSASFIPLYWLPRLSIMSEDGKSEEIGGEAGTLQLLERVSSISGPILGGVILGLFGFKYLFILAMVLIILSSFPILFIKNHPIDDGISWEGFWGWSKDIKNRHLLYSFIGQGWADLSEIVWPIFFFVAIGSFALLGGVSSMALAVSSIMTFLAGRIFDKLRKRKGKFDEREYVISTTVYSLLNGIRPVFTSVWGVSTIYGLINVVAPFWSVDYDSYTFSAGSRSGRPLVFYTYREAWYSFSRIVGALVCLVFLVMTDVHIWWFIFAFGGIGTLLTMGMQKES